MGSDLLFSLGDGSSCVLHDDWPLDAIHMQQRLDSDVLQAASRSFALLVAAYFIQALFAGWQCCLTARSGALGRVHLVLSSAQTSWYYIDRNAC